MEILDPSNSSESRFAIKSLHGMDVISFSYIYHFLDGAKNRLPIGYTANTTFEDIQKMIEPLLVADTNPDAMTNYTQSLKETYENGGYFAFMTGDVIDAERIMSINMTNMAASIKLVTFLKDKVWDKISSIKFYGISPATALSLPFKMITCNKVVIYYKQSNLKAICDEILNSCKTSVLEKNDFDTVVPCFYDLCTLTDEHGIYVGNTFYIPGVDIVRNCSEIIFKRFTGVDYDPQQIDKEFPIKKESKSEDDFAEEVFQQCSKIYKN